MQEDDLGRVTWEERFDREVSGEPLPTSCSSTAG